jgi:hypothetical protein
LTSSKWWIGGLGKAANHAIVMARLIINGKDFGPHPFCVQIRSLEDHRPLKGITVGDIGPKFGFNTVDNGFMMFDHYRIPHIAFLAGYSQVKPGTGEYIRPPNAKLSYGTMVFVRANIVMGKCIFFLKGMQSKNCGHACLRTIFQVFDMLLPKPLLSPPGTLLSATSLLMLLTPVNGKTKSLRLPFWTTPCNNTACSLSLHKHMHASSLAVKCLECTMRTKGT